MKKHAIISPCGQFRYMLSRTWDEQLPVLIFIMLNPSIADADQDDPTIRKDIGFAVRNDFGGILVFNLFAHRATDPRNLASAGFPVGPENDAIMLTSTMSHVAEGGAKVVCAWGANARKGVAAARAKEVRLSLANCGVPLHHLHLTSDGIPGHPLMLPYTCQITPWATDASSQ